jgi:hypothetical protein
LFAWAVITDASVDELANDVHVAGVPAVSSTM